MNPAIFILVCLACAALLWQAGVYMSEHRRIRYLGKRKGWRR